jgi:hypothetical protein
MGKIEDPQDTEGERKARGDQKKQGAPGDPTHELVEKNIERHTENLNFKCQSSCLRRSGFAQAGKCQMNAKWLNVKNFLNIFKNLPPYAIPAETGTQCVYYSSGFPLLRE